MRISISAVPRMSDRIRTYFHGTDTVAYLDKIMEEGLDSKATELKYGNKKPILRPVDSCVYITPNLAYALIYALGGDMAGHKNDRYKDRYGVVFAFEGTHLIDMSPDEDCVGLIARWLLAGTDRDVIERYYGKDYDLDKVYSAEITSYIRTSVHILTDNQYKNIKGYKGDECVVQTQIGKKLVKHMPDSVKLAMIDAGCHIAHKGRLLPNVAYQVDKERSQEFKRDGSNFFSIATKVR